MAEKKKDMPMNGAQPGGEIREKYKMKPGAMRGRGPGGRGRALERPKDAIGTTKRMLAYLKDYKLQLVIVALTLVVTAVTGVAATYFLKPIFNNLANMVGQSNPDLGPFIRTAGASGPVPAHADPGYALL